MAEHEGEGAYLLPIEWYFPEGLTSRYATNLVVQHTEHEFTISFFELRQPVVLGSPEERKAKLEQIQSVRAECMARVIVSAGGMESASPQAFGKIWIFGCSSSTPKWWVSSSQIRQAGQWPQPLVDPEPLDLADLQRAAEDQDHRAFAQLVRAIQWGKRPPNDLIRTANLALSLDMLRLARDLVEHGRKLFPKEKWLQRLAAVRVPPVILGTRQSRPAGFVSSQLWLKEHASEYRNQWIAVQDGRRLGAAPTLRELHQKIGPAGKAVSTIIVKVLPDGAI